MSVFETLNAINLNDKKEKKNNLDYISWAWAWAEMKKRYPDAYSTVYEDSRGLNYFTDGNTCYVKVGVTIEGLEHIEYLPVMDYKNKSIYLDQVTSMDINKAIQRALTKAIARHGLGLYVYAGEDLPEDNTINEPLICEECSEQIFGVKDGQGKFRSPTDVVQYSKGKYGKRLCWNCIKKRLADEQ